MRLTTKQLHKIQDSTPNMHAKFLLKEEHLGVPAGSTLLLRGTFLGNTFYARNLKGGWSLISCPLSKLKFLEYVDFNKWLRSREA